MFECETIQTTVLRGARRIEQRRVALAECDRLMMMSIEWQQFPISPNSALFERFVGHAPGSPGLLQQVRIHARFGKHHFEQTSATSRAIVERLINREARAAVLLKTRQLS